MRHISICLPLSRRMALVVTLGLLLSGSLPVQAGDLQIMVNGPWSYVADRHPEYDAKILNQDRIVLVAPSQSNTQNPHRGYIFPGTDAREASNRPIELKPSAADNLALYYVDFGTDLKTSESSRPKSEMPAAPYEPKHTVADSTIESVLFPYNGTLSRFAISLPMPNSISTYHGKKGVGLAESKIKVGKIAKDTKQKDYTTWMVLHYTVTVMPSALQLSKLVKVVNNTATVVPESAVKTDSSELGRSGVSILLMGPEDKNGPSCDEVSGSSFSASMKLWGLHEHARYPVQLDDKGKQDRGNYDYNCKEYHEFNYDQIQTRLAEVSELNAQTISDIRLLKKDLFELRTARMKAKVEAIHERAVTVQADVLGTFDRIDKNLGNLWPDGKPKPVSEALRCTRAFLRRQHDLRCPNLLGDRQIEKYFGEKKTGDSENGVLYARGVGHSDCHQPQVNINGELQ